MFPLMMERNYRSTLTLCFGSCQVVGGVTVVVIIVTVVVVIVVIIIIPGELLRPIQGSANGLISPRNIYKICLLTQTAQMFVSERQLH
jgi:hypothetical protein